MIEVMKRVILLHGNGGSRGTDNWFPYIKSELTKLGVTCIAPDLPDPVLARASYWLPYFKNKLNIGADDIVIGHSSGALSILKYAEMNKIGASVLVGTYYTDLGYEDEMTSGYFDTPWNWKQIKDNQEWTAIFASTDDPYIPIDEPLFIKNQLDSTYFGYTNKGHFGGHNHPMLEFPELLGFLKTKLNIDN